ncbi:MAG TPA: class I SAM-dependent methyltransferase [Ferruginibacter sp.]|nr:class I SAM-dependent methyltransferase [Ferruginibacter sp.]
MKLFKRRKKQVRKWNSSLVNEREKRISEICKAKDFLTEWHKRWCSEIKETPRFHRKQWEFTYVLQSLWERGCIAKGHNGLVFAVGTEKLPALMATYGCNIVATDIHPDEGVEKGWANGDQLCFGVEQLNKAGICEQEEFLRRVTYRPVDMNNIPDDLKDFDYTWSSCSFEHLGSLEKGFNFLKNQMKTLKPGGWAVHTTEYNISSNDETLEEENTVIYRQRDIDYIVSELRNEGHFVEELDFSLGGLPEDFQVDYPPHTQLPHVKLQLDKFVVTSIGLIIQKKY